MYIPGGYTMSRLLISEVKSMLELKLSAFDIAHRLCASVDEVILAINYLKSC